MAITRYAPFLLYNPEVACRKSLGPVYKIVAKIASRQGSTTANRLGLMHTAYKAGDVLDRVKMKKLSRSTIVNIEPVYYNNYLEEGGYPVDFYDYKGSLFLVYCGVESIKRLDNSYKIKFKNKFNTVCLQYGVGTRKGLTHDDSQLFFKVQGNSLVNYNRGNGKNFYITFFELDEVKPSYTPR